MAAAAPLVYNLPADSLPVEQMKEQISVAYIRMVAAAAGCTVGDWSADFDGVDISIKSHAEYPEKLGPTLDVQLKCTSKKDVVKADHIAWQIDERTHKYLASGKRSVPAILAVLVVPEDREIWLDHNEERLLMASTMYWVAGSDIPALPDGQKTLTVHLPRSNRFTREALLGIMRAIGERSDGWRI